MTATGMLRAHEERHANAEVAREMHAFFTYLRRNDWFDEVVDSVFDEVTDFLADEGVPRHARLESMKRELAHTNPDGVENAVFRFLINDTLERVATEEARPVHWVTYAYFVFRWKEDTPQRMAALRDALPEFIHG